MVSVCDSLVGASSAPRTKIGTHAVDARILAYRVWRSAHRGAVDNKMSGYAFKEELGRWHLDQTPCPRQTDGTSCGVHAFLNAGHIISGHEIPREYAAEQIRAVRQRMQLLVLRVVCKALAGG